MRKYVSITLGFLSITLIVATICLAIVGAFQACSSKSYAENGAESNREVYGIELIILDSCEYYFYNQYSYGTVLTHKQNCKFCKQRFLAKYPTFNLSQEPPMRFER